MCFANLFSAKMELRCTSIWRNELEMVSKRTPVTSMRLDPELKAEAQKVFSRLHINMTAAVSMYLSEVVRTQGIPLPLQEPHHDISSIIEKNQNR